MRRDERGFALIITLIITASGVFTEMQSTLNIIWKAEPRGTTVTRLLRARAASLGLVGALGFLLLVSLVVSTLLSALSNYINASHCSLARSTKYCRTGISHGTT